MSLTSALTNPTQPREGNGGYSLPFTGIESGPDSGSMLQQFNVGRFGPVDLLDNKDHSFNTGYSIRNSDNQG
jgi:hypothetical protein